MASLQANGITLEYQVEGQGEPLLLVMGLGGQLTSWPAEFVTQLASLGFQVIRFDNRDSGLSSTFSSEPPGQFSSALRSLLGRKPKSEYFISDMAADAIGLLDGLGIASAHVVGMSMGGMIAQTMAFTYPDRVRSLCSVMSNTGDRKGGISPKLMTKLPKLTKTTRENAAAMSTELFALISGDEFDREEHLVGAIADVERSYLPEGTARQTAAIMASPARNEDLMRVVAPTLVVHGLADNLVAPSGGIATAKCIRQSRLVMYPGMGHNLPPSRWAEMVDEIVTNTNRVAADVDLTSSVPAAT